MVWKHDAARSNVNRRRFPREDADHQLGRRTRDGGGVVVLRQPDAAVAKPLGDLPRFDRIVKRLRTA